MGVNLTELSRAVSYALRHAPWLYELELDDEGWASIESLLSALRGERPAWSNVTETDLARMIAASSKRRHEISGSKIRALYGHSVPGRLRKAPAVPPDLLYHGTAPSSVPCIRLSGLLPMGRQYVHLSVDAATAAEVGRRKAPQPMILRVLASDAHANGIRFYEGNEKVWLADQIPAEFIAFDG
ncbi:MAG: RNA 2'-phosphotransferase [Thermoguttaceae bacterium]